MFIPTSASNPAKASMLLLHRRHRMARASRPGPGHRPNFLSGEGSRSHRGTHATRHVDAAADRPAMATAWDLCESSGDFAILVDSRRIRRQ